MAGTRKDNQTQKEEAAYQDRQQDKAASAEWQQKGQAASQAGRAALSGGPQEQDQQPMQNPMPARSPMAMQGGPMAAPMQQPQLPDAHRDAMRQVAAKVASGQMPMKPQRNAIGDALGSGTPAMSMPVGKDQLAKAERLMLKYKAGKSSVDARIIRAQQWWKLRNWDLYQQQGAAKGSNSDYKSNTAWLWNCIIGKHADAIDSFPEPIVLPRMMDDKEEARKLTSIIPVVMDINGFEEVYNDAMWQKYQEGTGCYGVFWDKSKLNGLGDIAIRKVNMLNLCWEPGVTDIQDSANLFYITLMDKDALVAAYPEMKDKPITTNISISKYITDDNVDTEDMAVIVDWYYKRTVNGKRTVQYCKFCGDQVLYATENIPDMAERGLYDDGNYPFVLDPLYPVAGSPAGYGLIDIGADVQRDIDIISQALVQNTACASTPRYFIRSDGSVNEQEFADFSKPFIHVDGNLGQDSILPISVTPIQGNAISMLQQKIDELKWITGNTDINNGGTPTGVTAASAIAALKEDSGRSSKDSNKASYRAYRRLVTMVIERVRQFYDLPRTFRILGARGNEQFTSYSNAGIVPQSQGGMEFGVDMGMRLPQFDIEVRAQRENAYTKMSNNELALQFYGSGFFNPQMADQALMCLDMMDFKGKDEIVQKLQQQQSLLQVCVNVLQIALDLAQQYDPATAEQLAQLTMFLQQQGVLGAVQPQQEGGGGMQMPKGSDGSTDKRKQNPMEQRTAERVASASRPD